MFLRRLFRLFCNLLIFFFLSTILAVIVYRFVPVYLTPLMVIRCVENKMAGNPSSWHHQWIPLSEMTPHLPLAVIASEDNRFAFHSGFDFEEIKKARVENKTRKRPRGASTITQQTAKNVFLWPHASWIRKGLEAYFTVLIEFIWNKEHIMEVYLNSIEMGENLYGAEAAAHYKFGKNAKSLTAGECALIAASLPNPRKYDSGNPSSYLLQRQKKILRLMQLVPEFPGKSKTNLSEPSQRNSVSKKKK